MLLADMSDAISTSFVRFICVLIVFMVVIQKWLGKNPEVKDAAKKAATAKAINLISKWLK